jgi:hypothetical protein
MPGVVLAATDTPAYARRYRQPMASLVARRRNLAIASLALTATLLPGLALAATSPARKASAAVQHSVLQSRLLWATINVCSPSDQPDTVGIRGSMPGDGHVHDTLYMSFRLQYESGTGNNTSWSPLSGAESGFVSVGGGGDTRQAGRSFTLVPVPGRHSTLRGVVTFEWRRGSKVMRSTERTTTSGHISQTGADPKSYTAATCTIS